MNDHVPGSIAINSQKFFLRISDAYEHVDAVDGTIGQCLKIVIERTEAIGSNVIEHWANLWPSHSDHSTQQEQANALAAINNVCRAYEALSQLCGCKIAEEEIRKKKQTEDTEIRKAKERRRKYGQPYVYSVQKNSGSHLSTPPVAVPPTKAQPARVIKFVEPQLTSVPPCVPRPLSQEELVIKKEEPDDFFGDSSLFHTTSSSSMNLMIPHSADVDESKSMYGVNLEDDIKAEPPEEDIKPLEQPLVDMYCPETGTARPIAEGRTYNEKNANPAQKSVARRAANAGNSEVNSTKARQAKDQLPSNTKRLFGFARMSAEDLERYRKPLAIPKNFAPTFSKAKIAAGIVELPQSIQIQCHKRTRKCDLCTNRIESSLRYLSPADATEARIFFNNLQYNSDVERRIALEAFTMRKQIFVCEAHSKGEVVCAKRLGDDCPAKNVCK